MGHDDCTIVEKAVFLNFLHTFLLDQKQQKVPDKKQKRPTQKNNVLTK
jgi:hypothetical protein